MRKINRILIFELLYLEVCTAWHQALENLKQALQSEGVALAAWEMYDDQISSASIVTGIGVIHSKEIVVVANDATVKGDER